MTWRGLVLLLFQVVLAGLGWWLAREWGVALGLLLAAWLWLACDMWQAHRLLGWLRAMQSDGAPRMPGVWGELATRMRRWIRHEALQVEQSEQRLTDILAALQASPDGLILLDSTGHIEWCNQTAELQFGLDAQRDMHQLVGNLVRDPAFSHYWQQHDFERPVLLAGRHHLSTHPVHLSVQIYAYGEGRYLMLARDITAMEQADAMRREFVANVSHEIRTPLTVLVGFVETLQILALTEAERQRYLGLMAQQASRMQYLVQDLLTLSKLEGSPLPRMDQWCSITPVLDRCETEARALSALVAANTGQLHAMQFLRSDHSDCELAGISEELQSAFSNLISNAIRYTPAGGQITVRWACMPDGGAQFAVTDSGQGIDAEHLGRLTERFYRIDRSRSRETGGTGLGLAIVKHVIQRHGAQLHIDSAVGRGSTFSITFPAQRVRWFPASES